MRARCLNVKDPQYHNYGGRGITVCERWLTLACFVADVPPPPFPNAKLERIDNHRGYEPGNVRWATQKEQNRNMRTNHWLTVNGTAKIMTDWMIQTGIRDTIIFRRLRSGWTPEQAVGYVPPPELKNEAKLPRGWTRKAKDAGLSHALVWRRVMVLGWTFEESISRQPITNHAEYRPRQVQF
jgi:hypothetical protein